MRVFDARLSAVNVELNFELWICFLSDRTTVVEGAGVIIPRYPLLESAALTTYFRPRGPLPFKIYFRERVFSQPLLPLLLSLSNQGEQICTKIGG